MLIKLKRVFLFFCVVLVMGAIFGFSSQTYKQTMKTSNIITIPIENQVKKEKWHARDIGIPNNIQDNIKGRIILISS